MELTDIGKGRGGCSAHRKSTDLNINPGCQDRMALATEDKEGHCFFLLFFFLFSCECRAAFWSGDMDSTFSFLNCTFEAVPCYYYYNSGIKQKLEKFKRGRSGNYLLKNTCY